METARERNPQELDLLARNTKKIKCNETALEDAMMGEADGDGEDLGKTPKEGMESSDNGEKETRQPTFKNMLVGRKSDSEWDDEDEFGPIR